MSLYFPIGSSELSMGVSLKILGFFLLSFIDQYSSISISNNELIALEELYISTNGSNWIWRNQTGPNTGAVWSFEDAQQDPCADDSTGTLLNWQGIGCNLSPLVCARSKCKIIEIQLSLYDLRGSLPSEIGYLTNLEILNIFSNFLTVKDK